MRYGAKLGVIPKVREMINVFGGVNKLPGCGENEFAEMSNMTCDRYPRAAAREPRLEVELTKKNLENINYAPETEEITEDVWYSYEEDDQVEYEEEEYETQETAIDNREHIQINGMQTENPGYGYAVKTTTKITERRLYEYGEINGEKLRRVIRITRVKKETIERIVKASDPHNLTFNGDHVFYLDRIKIGETYVYSPILDGVDLLYTGLFTDVITDRNPKHSVVVYGAYFIIYPEMFYVNSENPEDSGSAEYKASGGQTQELYLSDASGRLIVPDFISEYGSAPTSENGADEGSIWLTKVGNDPKMFMLTGGEWSEIDSFLTLRTRREKEKITTGDIVYLKSMYSFPNNVNGIKQNYPQRIVYATENGEDSLYVMSGCIVPDFAHPDSQNNYKVTVTSVNISFFEPELDFVFESGGRLWGCRYGKQWKTVRKYLLDVETGELILEEPDGEFVNEIYCTAARSFTQWQRFTGEDDGGSLDTDSFVFNVSEAGAFTGGCVYNGVPTFFKKDTMYRVSGSLSSGFSLYSDSVPGVQEGSSDGICVVNGVLYYKASTGVYAYAGGMPTRVSDKLGSVVMRDAVAGSYDNKAVFFMKELGQSRLYIYDTETGAWTIEETDPVLGMTGIDDGLVVQTTKGFFMMSQRMEQMKEYAGLSVNAVERVVPWSCCTGLMGLANTAKKYVVRIELRYLMPVGSMFFIDVEYDSSGRRVRVGQYQGSEKLETQVAAIRLRRCDHFRLYMQGIGACEIVTITKTTEGGSDVNG